MGFRVSGLWFLLRGWGLEFRVEGLGPGAPGLVFKAHRLFVSLNSRLESNIEEKKKVGAPGRR